MSGERDAAPLDDVGRHRQVQAGEAGGIAVGVQHQRADLGRQPFDHPVQQGLAVHRDDPVSREDPRAAGGRSGKRRLHDELTGLGVALEDDAVVLR